MGKYIKDLYDAYENTPFIEMFNMREPVLMRKEPKILKDVLIKDSSIFYNRQMDSCTKVCISFHGDNHYVIFLFDLKIWWLNLYPRTHRREPLRHFLFFNTGLTVQHLKTKILSSFIEIDTNSLARETNEEDTFLKYSESVRDTNWKGIVKSVMRDTVQKLYNLLGYYMFDNAKITVLHRFSNQCYGATKKTCRL